jgi:hypothetical protein
MILSYSEAMIRTVLHNAPIPTSPVTSAMIFVQASALFCAAAFLLHLRLKQMGNLVENLLSECAFGPRADKDSNLQSAQNSYIRFVRSRWSAVQLELLECKQYCSPECWKKFSACIITVLVLDSAIPPSRIGTREVANLKLLIRKKQDTSHLLVVLSWLLEILVVIQKLH